MGGILTRPWRHDNGRTGFLGCIASGVLLSLMMVVASAVHGQAPAPRFTNENKASSLCPLPAPPAQTGSPLYTKSVTLTDFTSTVAQYGEFVAGTSTIPLPITPTTVGMTASSSATKLPRVMGQGYPCVISPPFDGIIVKFRAPVSRILVFPSLDHVAAGLGLGSYGWDAYQYSIWGLQLSGTTVTAQTLLFDPVTVVGPNSANGATDPHYTLGTWSGTGPVSVNNYLTPGVGIGGVNGYEMYFDFGPTNQYQYYGFASSSATTVVGAEREVELYAVAEPVPFGSLSVTKVVRPDPKAIGATLSFAMKVTCNGPQGTFSYALNVKGNTSHVPNELLVGSKCSVTESLPFLPHNCSWSSPKYSPPVVTIGTGLSALMVTNSYICH